MNRAEVKRSVRVELKMLRAIRPARIVVAEDERAVNVVADDASAIGPAGEGGRGGPAREAGQPWQEQEDGARAGSD